MSKKVLYSVIALLVASSTVAFVGYSSAQPAQDESVQREFLEPVRPGDPGWEVKPFQPSGQSAIVQGPSTETGYRCVVFLEPVQPGETSSKATEPVCAAGPIDTVHGQSLNSSFLLAKFYDNTNYNTLLIEYYGSQACSTTVTYERSLAGTGLDNRFASGESFSNCNAIFVYDFADYQGATYACGPNCPTFFVLNDNVSAWRLAS